MKKYFEVKPVKDLPSYGKIKSALTIPLFIGAAGIMAGCPPFMPLAGIPHIEFVEKQITTVDSFNAPIPGLRFILASSTDHSYYWEYGTTDDIGSIIIYTEKPMLPLDIIIDDIDGATNGSFVTKTIIFDDEDPETIIMEEEP